MESATMQTPKPRNGKLDEVARHLGMSRRTVQNLIYRGLLPTVHFGRLVRIPWDAVAKLERTGFGLIDEE